MNLQAKSGSSADSYCAYSYKKGNKGVSRMLRPEQRHWVAEIQVGMKELEGMLT